jgi:hypothetical protein
MESTQNKIYLKERIANWQSVVSGGSMTQEDIKELSTQLEDKFAEFIGKGLTEDEAWDISKT